MRLLLFSLSILQIVHGSCPDGLELIRDGQCRGNYSRTVTPHDDAVTSAIAKCSEIQGFPLSIHSDEEQAYWSGKYSEFKWRVMGLICNSATKLWQWADGTPLDYKPPKDKYEESLDQDCTTNWKTWWLGSDGYWSGEHSTSQMTTDVFCTVQLEPPVAAADGCDSFEDDSDDGICYQIADVADNFQGAQMLCKDFGANVASIHNMQENSFIRRLAVSKGAVDGVYLGASVSGKGYDFAWLDGTSWDYENFHQGFPKTGYGDCLAMDTSVSSGLWMNINCSENLPVACIRDQKEVVEPTCSDRTWEEGQIITSPGFPFNASTYCDYFLTVDVGKKVEAVIELEANSCCDYLTIYDGTLGGHLIANLTGNVLSKVVKTTTSNIMRVNWVPNGAVNVKGLVMSFKGVLH